MQALPSEQVDPFAFAGLEHTPVALSQVPTSWHASDALHATGLLPVHTPFWQVSVRVHESPSAQLVPLATAECVHVPEEQTSVVQALLSLQSIGEHAGAPPVALIPPVALVPPVIAPPVAFVPPVVDLVPPELTAPPVAFVPPVVALDPPVLAAPPVAFVPPVVALEPPVAFAPPVVVRACFTDESSSDSFELPQEIAVPAMSIP